MEALLVVLMVGNLVILLQVVRLLGLLTNRVNSITRPEPPP